MSAAAAPFCQFRTLDLEYKGEITHYMAGLVHEDGTLHADT